MKKLLFVIALVLVPMTLFATYDVAVRAGGAMTLLSGKTSIDAKNSDKMSDIKFDALGLGFEFGLELDLTKNLQMYMDLSMAFPEKVTIGDQITPEDVNQSMEADKSADPEYKFHSGHTFFRTFSAHIGFAHRFDTSLGSLELTAGAGFGVNRISEGFKMVMKKDSKPYYYADYRTVTTLSVGLYTNLRYNLTDRISVVLTAMPDVGFFTIARHVDYDKKDSENYSTLTETELTESSGFAFSFGAKATIGFSYMF